MVFLLAVLLRLAPIHRMLAISVTPVVSLAPATIHIKVTLEPQPDQRLFRLEADGDTYNRATEMPLDGAKSPRTFYITWGGFPPGDYALTASVATQSSVVVAARRTFIVTGGQD